MMMMQRLYRVAISLLCGSCLLSVGCSQDKNKKDKDSNTVSCSSTEVGGTETGSCDVPSISLEGFDMYYEANEKALVFTLSAASGLKLKEAPSASRHRIYLGRKGEEYEGLVTFKATQGGSRIVIQSDTVLGFGRGSLYMYLKGVMNLQSKQGANTQLGVKYERDGTSEYLRSTISGGGLQYLMDQYKYGHNTALQGFGAANIEALEDQLEAIVKELHAAYAKASS